MLDSEGFSSDDGVDPHQLRTWSSTDGDDDCGTQSEVQRTVATIRGVSNDGEDPAGPTQKDEEEESEECE